MSRTDKDSPYEVRVTDPTEPLRYWNTTWNRWDLNLYPRARPSRQLRRARWSSVRSREQAWRADLMRRAAFIRRPWFNVEPLDLPEQPRHEMLWAWW